ncbi:MAG: hypothetical protein Q8908_07910, partial [Bacteroidota bacterium]|nr:hypothetical protein [Bacteroidota bacterium]
MNQKTFEELVNDSNLLNKDTIPELEQLLKEYPFCQTFHLLYAKNLYLQKHIRYRQQLKLAAAVVGDRARLKYYIEGTGFAEKIKNKKEQNKLQQQYLSNSGETSIIENTNTHLIKLSSDEKLIAAKEQPKEEIIHVSLPDAIIADNPIEKSVAEPNDQLHNGSIPELQSRENILQQEEAKTISSMPVEGNVEVDSPVLSSTLDASMSREEKKKALIALINKKFEARSIVAKENGTEKKKDEPENGKVLWDDVEINSEINTHKNEEHEIPVKFNLNVEKVSPSDSGINAENDPDTYQEDILDNVLSETASEMPPATLEKEVKTPEVLIDKFLRDAPRMPRPKQEFFNPVNLASRSLVENEDFYTETYASIC